MLYMLLLVGVSFSGVSPFKSSICTAIDSQTKISSARLKLAKHSASFSMLMFKADSIAAKGAFS